MSVADFTAAGGVAVPHDVVASDDALVWGDVPTAPVAAEYKERLS